jgi:hypothetical protein
MVGRGGTIDSSQRGHGELGTVGQVEPRSAAVDEGGLAVAWRSRTPAVPFLAVLWVFYSRCHGHAISLRTLVGPGWCGDASDVCQFRDTDAFPTTRSPSCC